MLLMKRKFKQPKFDQKKDPVTEKGDGLEEYVSEEPNFKPGDVKKNVKRKK